MFRKVVDTSRVLVFFLTHSVAYRSTLLIFFALHFFKFKHTVDHKLLYVLCLLGLLRPTNFHL